MLNYQASKHVTKKKIYVELIYNTKAKGVKLCYLLTVAINMSRLNAIAAHLQ